MEGDQIFREISNEPAWFLRWGTYMIFLFFCILLVFSFFFSYNEVIHGKVTITSENPSVHVQANQTGRLMEFQIHIGDKVSKDEVLAVIENPAAKKDLEYLKDHLLSEKINLSTIQELRSEYPPYLNLGISVQPYYKEFLRTYQQLIMDSFLQDDAVLREQFLEQLSAHNITLGSKAEEIRMSEKSMEIVLEDYNRNERLYQNGIISKKDFETVIKHLNEEEIKMKGLIKEYKVLLAQGNEFNAKDVQLKNFSIRNDIYKNTELLIAHQELLNAINNWESQYLLKSPIDGKVSYVDEWGKISGVASGEIVFSIDPHQRKKIVGRAIVPGGNSGKLKIGQRAILKLDNYPPREWGTLNAKTKNFAQLPGRIDSANLVYFEIPELTTSYGKKLEFKQNLSGTVEILLEEITIMERIFYQFRHLWLNIETL